MARARGEGMETGIQGKEYGTKARNKGTGHEHAWGKWIGQRHRASTGGKSREMGHGTRVWDKGTGQGHETRAR